MTYDEAIERDDANECRNVCIALRVISEARRAANAENQLKHFFTAEQRAARQAARDGEALVGNAREAAKGYRG